MFVVAILSRLVFFLLWDKQKMKIDIAEWTSVHPVLTGRCLSRKVCAKSSNRKKCAEYTVYECGLPQTTVWCILIRLYVRRWKTRMCLWSNADGNRTLPTLEACFGSCVKSYPDSRVFSHVQLDIQTNRVFGH